MRVVSRPVQTTFALVHAGITANNVWLYMDTGSWVALALAMLTAAAGGSHATVALLAPMIRRAEP